VVMTRTQTKNQGKGQLVEGTGWKPTKEHEPTALMRSVKTTMSESLAELLRVEYINTYYAHTVL